MKAKQSWLSSVLVCAVVLSAVSALPALAEDKQPGGEVEYRNSLGMTFQWIPAGTFVMGSPKAEETRSEHEGPQHKVTLTQPFLFQTHELTQGQWQQVMGTTIADQRDNANPDWMLCGEGENLPMYYVSWDEAQQLCEKLSEMDGRTYRLPTEAEWEYACRAGTTTRFYWGDKMKQPLDPCDIATLEDDPCAVKEQQDDYHFAWFQENAGLMVHPVGTKKPNPWGLYDMSGNIAEWCEDWFEPKGYSEGPVTDPTGPNSGSYRVVRGGSWQSVSSYCRSASRYRSRPDARRIIVGIRLVVEPE